ncbi:MAG: surface-adhesin E family protein [Betaproteobacteria bacterium]
MRTPLLIAVAALAAAAGPALAATDWQSLGENANGNRIFVDKGSVKAGAGFTAVTFRTELKAALDTPGGAITSMRSQMRVDCKNMTAAGVEVVLYEDEAKNKAFSRNKAQKIEYLKEPAGSSADLVIRHVCK